MTSTATTLNIASHLPAMAALRPDALAIVCPGPRERNGRPTYVQLTFAELDRLSDQYARGLTRIGVQRGMRVVLMIRPGVEFFALTFALFKIGAVVVLIDPGIGIKKLGVCIAEVEPKAFIGIGLAHAARTLMRWARETIEINVTVGRRWFWGGSRLDELIDDCADPFPPVDARADETAAILFTSGSTGPPKGAVYTHGVFNAQVQYLKDQFEIEPGEVDLATFPLFALFDPALGMTAVIPDMDASKPAEADPRKLIEAIQDQGVTQMFGSPALIDRLTRYAEREGIKLPSIKRALSAGAPVRPDILKRFRAVLGEGAEILTPYGATEALPVSSIDAREVLEETQHESAQGGGTCVGAPVPQVEVSIIRITDEPIERWSDDLRVPEGEIGEIVVKGPIVTREYYGRPNSTALAKIKSEDGDEVYHRMGDLGRLDTRGRLWFYGRKNHRVTTADGDLFTISTEAVFNQHPKVFRSALVGVGPRGAQRPVLCVELEKEAGSADRESVIADLLTLGAAHEHTRAVRSILFHPSFPVDPRHNAKIVRERLAEWARKRIR